MTADDASRSDEIRPPIPFGQWPCRGNDCTGRVFGAWSRCEHGLRERLAELELAADAIRAQLRLIRYSDD